jgi:hypothetical protein
MVTKLILLIFKQLLKFYSYMRICGPCASCGIGLGGEKSFALIFLRRTGGFFTLNRPS